MLNLSTVYWGKKQKQKKLTAKYNLDFMLAHISNYASLNIY